MMSYSYNSNLWHTKKTSSCTKKKYWRKSPSFQFAHGGNPRDPLNLKPLLDQDTTTNSTQAGKDHLVEIVLPPNIYDPLCLDSSSQNRLEYSPMNYDIPSQVHATPSRSNYRPKARRRSQVPSHWRFCQN